MFIIYISFLLFFMAGFDTIFLAIIKFSERMAVVPVIR